MTTASITSFTSRQPIDAIDPGILSRLTAPRLKALARMSRQRRYPGAAYASVSLDLNALASKNTPPAIMALRTGLSPDLCAVYLAAHGAAASASSPPLRQ